MMRFPKHIENENMRIFNDYMSQFTEEEIDEPFDDADYQRWFQERASKDLKEVHEYMKRIGDEGELMDKDGTSLLDAEGYWIQNFEESEDGFLIFPNGEPIFYTDGTRVPAIIIPDCLKDDDEDE